MHIKSRVTMLCVLAMLGVAGPWSGASADDWPAPGGDPFASDGVVLADLSLPSTGAVGFRVTLPTGGILDALGWIDTGSPANGGGSADDDSTAIGGLFWHADQPPGPRPNIWFLVPNLNSGPDVRASAIGATFVDERSPSGTDLWEGVGAGSTGFAPGTYDVVVWAATNSPSATTRFRLRASPDATLVNETVSTTAFLRGLRQFSGTASAAVDTLEIAPSVAVDESTSIDVTHTLYGGFNVGIVQPGGAPTIPLAHYTGPDGVHTVSTQAHFNGSAAGSYTFTLDNDVWATWEPFVAGADLVTP